jgi:hypothetical protein
MEQLTVLQAVVAERADGGITVRRLPVLASEDCYDAATAAGMGFTLDDGVWSRDLTDDMIVADLAKAGIEWVSWRRVDEANIPDRDFRDAWQFDGSAIVHDMAKARAIHRDRMRAARVPLLAALDIAYQRADEVGDTAGKADVAARKQALRDVTADPAIAAATTPAALRAVWPEILTD